MKRQDWLKKCLSHKDKITTLFTRKNINYLDTLTKKLYWFYSAYLLFTSCTEVLKRKKNFKNSIYSLQKKPFSFLGEWERSNLKMPECFIILISIKAIPVQGIIVDDKKIMYMIKCLQKVRVMWWTCIKHVIVRHSLSKRFISSLTLMFNIPPPKPKPKQLEQY